MEHSKRARSGKPRTQPREATCADSTTLPSELERIRQAARRDKEAKFTALWHHVYNVERLRGAYYGLKRTAAPGVDGKTWKQYGEDLEHELEDLSKRLRQGAYRAKPVRRAYIPKPDGRQRPLGVTALEDKIVQRATVEVLNAIYETDFLGFSYGFRPGRNPHNALDALYVGIRGKQVNWVLDADIRGYFETIDHGWLKKFIEHRVGDKRVVGHVQKWLKAGVLEEGRRTQKEEGTPQGGNISPLLANVYLHYVFDLWANQWRKKQARGEIIIVRYADDFVVGFQHRSEAEQFLKDLQERFKEFGLELNAEKTRLIEFGRYAETNRKGRGEGKPETFDFLGFTHACGRTRKGRFAIVRQTVQKRQRAKLREIKAELRRRLHAPVPETGKWLRSVVLGYYRYHAVPGNLRKLNAFRHYIYQMWRRMLQRRSQTHRLSWARMNRLRDRWLPTPHTLHPYPFKRLYVKT